MKAQDRPSIDFMATASTAAFIDKLKESDMPNIADTPQGVHEVKTLGRGFYDGAGASIGSSMAREARDEQNYDPERAKAEKQEAMAASRAWELVQIAQQLESLRARMIALGLETQARTVDPIVVSLIQTWTMERPHR